MPALNTGFTKVVLSPSFCGVPKIAGRVLLPRALLFPKVQERWITEPEDLIALAPPHPAMATFPKNFEPEIRTCCTRTHSGYMNKSARAQAQYFYS